MMVVWTKYLLLKDLVLWNLRLTSVSRVKMQWIGKLWELSVVKKRYWIIYGKVLVLICSVMLVEYCTSGVSCQLRRFYGFIAMNNLYDKTVNPHVFDYLHENSYAYNFYCPSEVVLHFIMFFI